MLIVDACQVSPARVSSVIAAAASDVNDTRWSNSNYGDCVAVYAPGVKVLSAMDASDSATLTATGGSMAAAHVTGVAALFLQSNPTASPMQVSHERRHLQSRFDAIVIPTCGNMASA